MSHGQVGVILLLGHLVVTLLEGAAVEAAHAVLLTLVLHVVQVTVVRVVEVRATCALVEL